MNCKSGHRVVNALPNLAKVFECVVFIQLKLIIPHNIYPFHHGIEHSSPWCLRTKIILCRNKRLIISNRYSGLKLNFNAPLNCVNKHQYFDADIINIL